MAITAKTLALTIPMISAAVALPRAGLFGSWAFSRRRAAPSEVDGGDGGNGEEEQRDRDDRKDETELRRPLGAAGIAAAAGRGRRVGTGRAGLRRWRRRVGAGRSGRQRCDRRGRCDLGRRWRRSGSRRRWRRGGGPGRRRCRGPRRRRWCRGWCSGLAHLGCCRPQAGQGVGPPCRRRRRFCRLGGPGRRRSLGRLLLHGPGLRGPGGSSPTAISANVRHGPSWP